LDVLFTLLKMSNKCFFLRDRAFRPSFTLIVVTGFYPMTKKGFVFFNACLSHFFRGVCVCFMKNTENASAIDKASDLS